MKLLRHRRCQGNTLALVLFMTGLMGTSLASYLLFVRNQNLSVMRSLAWNSCIPTIEAGIEEAMTHLNRSGVSNLLSANWTLGANGYTKTRYLGSNYFVVTISTNDPPSIVSQGFVPVPANPTAVVGFLAAIGLDSTATPGFSGRSVRVTTRKDGMWTHAMVAKSAINLNGNNIATDSFDSGDPSYSTSGQYDVNKRRDHGDVATDSTIINSLSVGNADIWGRAATGPGGSVSIGSQGSIGDLAWHQTHDAGIEPGFTNNDMNVYFKDVTRPFSSGFSPQSGILNGQDYRYLLDGGPTGADYVISDLTLNGNDVMLVTNNVRLLVTGRINITGNGQIEVAKNSSLKVYMQGESAAIGGNGLVNDTGYAINFLYFGLPTNTSLSFSGNGTFTGVVYAPEASFSLGGGGSNTQDFIGASVSNSVMMNGHFHFHYDEALGRSGWARGYVVDSWNEM